MKIFANFPTVSQMEGIFRLFKNHKHSHAIKDGRHTVLMPELFGVIRCCDDTSCYSIKNNRTQLLDLILLLWFFQDMN